MTTNDKNTQRFIVKLGDGRCEHFCAPLALPYTCVQKGEVICLRFSSVHLPHHPPTVFPVSIFRLPPVEWSYVKQKTTVTLTAKSWISLGGTATIFLLPSRATWHFSRRKEFELWNQRDTFEFGRVESARVSTFGYACQYPPYEKHIF